MNIYDLVGKDIIKVELLKAGDENPRAAKNEDRVFFYCKDREKPYGFETMGDCCSRTWIENFDDYKNIKGVVTEVNCLPQRKDSYDDDGDTIAFYGYSFMVGNKSYELDFRNSSNGYYGGSLDSIYEFEDEEIE